MKKKLLDSSTEEHNLLHRLCNRKCMIAQRTKNQDIIGIVDEMLSLVEQYFMKKLEKEQKQQEK